MISIYYYHYHHHYHTDLLSLWLLSSRRNLICQTTSVLSVTVRDNRVWRFINETSFQVAEERHCSSDSMIKCRWSLASNECRSLYSSCVAFTRCQSLITFPWQRILQACYSWVLCCLKRSCHDGTILWRMNCCVSLSFH